MPQRRGELMPRGRSWRCRRRPGAPGQTGAGRPARAGGGEPPRERRRQAASPLHSARRPGRARPPYQTVQIGVAGGVADEQAARAEKAGACRPAPRARASGRISHRSERRTGCAGHGRTRCGAPVRRPRTALRPGRWSAAVRERARDHRGVPPRAVPRGPDLGGEMTERRVDRLPEQVRNRPAAGPRRPSGPPPAPGRRSGCVEVDGEHPDCPAGARPVRRAGRGPDRRAAPSALVRSTGEDRDTQGGVASSWGDGFIVRSRGVTRQATVSHRSCAHGSQVWPVRLPAHRTEPVTQSSPMPRPDLPLGALEPFERRRCGTAA